MFRKFPIVCLILLPEVLPAQRVPEMRDVPDLWVVDYPSVEKVAPPTKSAFFDAANTILKRGSKTYRTEINGGYGRVAQGGGHRIVHVGVDVGLYRVNEPVYAAAAGVVRVSMGPKPATRRRSTDKQAPTNTGMVWGNFIVIEHRFPDEKYFTSVYGHLDSARLVRTGDVVKAGQMLGKIGRKDVNVNGGYVPHLHFGIREGRMAEPGSALTYVAVNGKYYPLILREVGPETSTVQLDLSKEIQVPAGVVIPGGIDVSEANVGLRQVPSGRLWVMTRPEFSLSGHTDKFEPWLDPLPFLRGHGATTRPARFHRARIKPATAPSAADTK